MGDLAKYKKERMPHRRLATLSIKAVTTLITETERGDYIPVLKGHLNVLKAKLAALEDLNTNIVGVIADEDLDNEISEANKYQLDIHMSIAAIEEALSTAITGRPNGTPESTSTNSRMNVKLPKVHIEPFHGDELSYPTFLDSFNPIIDRNDALSDIEKFYYLKGLLRGKAKATIEGLTLSEGNYKEALELLKQRFGDKKLLQASFIDALLKLKGVTDAKDVKSLRDLYDNIEKCIRNLKSLGITSDSFGPMLIPCILQKVPEQLRLEITKKLSGDNWDFDEVLKIFNDELSAREKCYFVNKPEKSVRPSRDLHTGSSLYTTETKENVCVYCGDKQHKAWECKIVTDIPTRRKILIEKRCCFNCLKGNHTVKGSVHVRNVLQSK